MDGKFLSRDPLRLGDPKRRAGQSQSSYLYVVQSPLLYIDPNGKVVDSPNCGDTTGCSSPPPGPLDCWGFDTLIGKYVHIKYCQPAIPISMVFVWTPQGSWQNWNTSFAGGGGGGGVAPFVGGGFGAGGALANFWIQLIGGLLGMPGGCVINISNNKADCCAQGIGILMNGEDFIAKTLKDYYPPEKHPELVNAQAYSDTPGKSGPFSNSKRVGLKVQIITDVSGDETQCHFTQEVTTKRNRHDGVAQLDEGTTKVDDIKKSGQDESKPPFRQYIGKYPSIADLPGNRNVISRELELEFTTCIISSPGSTTCKYTKCCLDWKTGNFGRDTSGVRLPKPWHGEKKCEGT